MDTNEKAIEMHKKWNGKLETISKTPVKTREDLSIAYTPGVAAPCRIIAENKEEAYTYTMKANTVAVVSDGSAVLGLGNIGALAAMPVMEGKAALFKEFGGVNAFPICLDTQDTEEIIDKMIHKILFLRIFEDENGKMNKSIQDVNGSILSISQFTLYADCKKGNRPSFTNAGKPDLATVLYDQFNQKLQDQGMHVEKGIFGADMKIELLNDGPVTIVLDSKELF